MVPELSAPGPALAHALLAAMVPARFTRVARAAAGETCRGAFYRRHGAADVLEVGDLPAPAPSPHHVRVAVAAAGVNPLDFKLRHHAISELGRPLPKVPGSDLAGTVVDAPDDCGFAPGDRVFGMMPFLGNPWGATATLVPVEPRFLAHTPEALSDVEAAALPLTGLTVLQGLRSALRALRPTAGRWALVQAASGGTGSVAVQLLARHHGMRVIGTCRAANAEFVTELGAEFVVDHEREAFDEVVRDVDLVFDPLGFRYRDRTLRSEVIRPGGHYVHLASSDWPQGETQRLSVPEARPGPILRDFARQLASRLLVPLGLGRAHVHHVFVHPDGDGLRELAEVVRRGHLRPPIDAVYPLEDVAEAHRHVETGRTRGKVVISLDGAS